MNIRNTIGLIAITMMLFLTGCIKDVSLSGVTVEIPASTITESLKKEFPINKNTQYGKVTLENPKALLQKGSDRITTDAAVSFSNALISKQKGSLAISGKPYFDAKSGNVYLTEPSIEKLSLNSSGMGGFMKGSVADLITPIVNEVFRKIPIYKVDTKSIQGSFLKSIRIEDGSLLLTFGL